MLFPCVYIKESFFLLLVKGHSYLSDVFLYYSNILHAEIDFQVPHQLLLGSFKE